MIQKNHFILYVKDQNLSVEFYSQLLDLEPILNVPGMAEFSLTDNSILGLMPIKGIEKLLENKITVSTKNDNEVKAELYLVVNNIDSYLERANLLNAEILSESKERDWGHKVAYLLDPDKHIVAFAEVI